MPTENSEPTGESIEEAENQKESVTGLTGEDRGSEHQAGLELVASNVKVEWRNKYTITVRINNTGTKDIGGAEIRLYEDGQIHKPSPSSLTIPISPGASNDADWEFAKSWRWYTTYVVFPLREVTKTCQYYADCQWRDGGTHDLRAPSSGDKSVNVIVPKWKKMFAADAAIALAVAGGLITAAVLTGGITGPAAAAEMALYNLCYRYMEDPFELDSDFPKLARFTRLPLRFPPSDHPLENASKMTAIALRNLVAVLEFLHITRDRAWTAFAYCEKNILAKQARAARDACVSAEGLAAESARGLDYLAKVLRRERISLGRKDFMAFKKGLRKEGLPKPVILILRRSGQTTRDIDFLTEALTRLDFKQAGRLDESLLIQSRKLMEISTVLRPLATQVEMFTREISHPKWRQKRLFRGGALSLEDVKQGKTKLTRH